MVLARIGAQSWAQPQREVPALEAALLQLHVGIQGLPPAAQASRSHAQHCIATRCWFPRREHPPAKVKGRNRRGLARENRIEKFEKAMKKMHAKHALRIKLPKRPLDRQQPPLFPHNYPCPHFRWSSAQSATGEVGHYRMQVCGDNPQEGCVILEDTELLALEGLTKKAKLAWTGFYPLGQDWEVLFSNFGVHTCLVDVAR